MQKPRLFLSVLSAFLVCCIVCVVPCSAIDSTHLVSSGLACYATTVDGKNEYIWGQNTGGVSFSYDRNYGYGDSILTYQNLRRWRIEDTAATQSVKIVFSVSQPLERVDLNDFYYIFDSFSQSYTPDFNDTWLIDSRASKWGIRSSDISYYVDGVQVSLPYSGTILEIVELHFSRPEGGYAMSNSISSSGATRVFYQRVGIDLGVHTPDISDIVSSIDVVATTTQEINGHVQNIDQTVSHIDNTVFSAVSDMQNPNGQYWQAGGEVIKDTLQESFVPSDSDTAEIQHEIGGVESTLKDQFQGAVEADTIITDQVSSLRDSMLVGRSRGEGIYFPGISVPAAGDSPPINLVSAQYVNLPAKFEPLRVICGTVISVICVLATLDTVASAVVAVFSSQSYAEWLRDRNEKDEAEEIMNAKSWEDW